LRALYIISLILAILFFVLGAVFKLFGGVYVLGIPPSAWIDKGTNPFLLFAIALILLRYLPEKE